MPLGLPMLLSSQAMSLGPGATAIVDSGRMVSPFRSPCVIEEIRFRLQTFTGPAAVEQLGGTIRVQLQVGRFKLTNGFIPVWCLGQAVQNGIEFSGGAVVNSGSGYYRWVLPAPLFVPPAVTVQCAVSRASVDAVQLNNAATKIPVVVTFSGRQLPPGSPAPDPYYVPYASAWLDEGTRAATQSDGSSSSDDHLVNPFSDKPLFVQRMIGRIDGINAGAGSEYDYLGKEPTMTLVDSSKYWLVKEATSFNEVFDPFRRSWTFNRWLAPRGWYTLKMVSHSVAAATVTRMFPQVAIVGYREERP